ncbi:MAG: ATP12 family protein [Pseudomonadota bacterium]
MAEWDLKRFWTETSVAYTEGEGWQVLLDKRVLRTPGKSMLVLPTEQLAAAVSAEWAAQDEKVDPGTMPMTRTANSAIERVAPQREAIVPMLAAYGETDLLSYRAEGPDALVRRQADGWDPLLDWAADTLKAPLGVTAGLIHASQPHSSLITLRRQIEELSNFQLAAAHDLIAISGSLILALATMHGRLAPDAAWKLSRVDEDWQSEQWGADEEASQAAEQKRLDFFDAHTFFTLAQSGGR